MKLITVTATLLTVAAISTGGAHAAGQGFVPVRLHEGMTSPGVKVLQKYLRMNRRWNYYKSANGYDSIFGPGTEKGLMGWQQAVGRQPTGWIVIGSSEWNQLRKEALRFRLPSYIDEQSIGAARQNGWAVDASKSPGMVTVLRYGRYGHKMTVALSIAASYGGFIDGKYRPSTNGVFHIFAAHGYDYTAHVPGQPWDGALMRWAACYNGGECLHYDPLGASHGCIHIPSLTAAKYIHDLPIGTAVVVHA